MLFVVRLCVALPKLTNLLGQLESAVETKADESTIKEIMKNTDSKFTECMLLMERKVQMSA